MGKLETKIGVLNKNQEKDLFLIIDPRIIELLNDDPKILKRLDINCSMCLSADMCDETLRFKVCKGKLFL